VLGIRSRSTGRRGEYEGAVKRKIKRYVSEMNEGIDGERDGRRRFKSGMESFGTLSCILKFALYRPQDCHSSSPPLYPNVQANVSSSI
jgi:hypothetical protein